jgi:hypothetical protein
MGNIITDSETLLLLNESGRPPESMPPLIIAKNAASGSHQLGHDSYFTWAFTSETGYSQFTIVDRALIDGTVGSTADPSVLWWNNGTASRIPWIGRTVRAGTSIYFRSGTLAATGVLLRISPTWLADVS